MASNDEFVVLVALPPLVVSPNPGVGFDASEVAGAAGFAPKGVGVWPAGVSEALFAAPKSVEG